jgi:hypothetical protein
VNGEADERLPRGPKGERGEQGLPGMSRGARRAFTYLLILIILLTALNLLWTSRQTGEANRRAQAQCRFDADLGGAPAPVAGATTGKPSLLAVTIVSDARVAWHQTGCAGHLDAPSPSFRRWAAYYRLPAG